MYCACFILELTELQAEYNSVKLEDEESVDSYQQIRLCLRDVLQKQWKYVRRPEYIVSFLQPGRLIKVSSPLTLIAMMFPLLAFNWVIGAVQ